MSVDLEKNIYGLSEGVFKACKFLGLKFPPEVSADFSASQEHMPSDYFGDNFELTETIKNSLQVERKLTEEKFKTIYKEFTAKFNSQRCFSKKNKTDWNIYFCDYMLFSRKQGATIPDYFDFEFYRKSLALRNTFRVSRSSRLTQRICNDFNSIILLRDKAKTNKIFADFLHRDWLDTPNCTFEEFKAFVEKHPRFFSKQIAGAQGRGAEIISVNSNEDLENLFDNLKNKKKILEEIVKQHKDIAAFCPDTVNTIRVYTILDVHNVVHILATNGRFGRLGGVVDNVHVGGGQFVTIDPKTGILISDGLTNYHERIPKHPDTGKTFKGFQYPCWEKVLELVQKAAKMIPQLRHIAWDIAINDKDEAILIEANGTLPALGIQQAPDDTGRQPLYTPLLEEIINYKWEQVKFLGYRVNNLNDFDSVYYTKSRQNSRLKLVMNKLIPDCKSLIDLGCRKSKLVKAITPPRVLKYYPVDFQKHDDEVIACNFNSGEFPDIKADTCLCAFTAEYVEPLPQFLANMCNAAQKQILMLCRPFTASEVHDTYRWENPFLTDFTEEFLIKTMEQNNFQLNAKYPLPKVAAIVIYDFRRI